MSGSKVGLRDMKAALAGGTISVDGDLDFGADPTLVSLEVSAEKLDTRKLPPEWNLPKDFEGKLKGHAELVLKFIVMARLNRRAVVKVLSPM